MTDSLGSAIRITNDWYLGKTSATHETSGRGVETISTGKGDSGGVSYGAYQLSTNRKTVDEYLEQSAYKDHFSGLRPATDAFNTKWRELATSDPGFAAEQHEFIRRTHYDVQVRELQARGLDLSDRGRAVQDALWSTSVQYRKLTPGIVSEGLAEKFGSHYSLSQLSDKDIVEAIQDYKIVHNNRLFRNSRDQWNGLLRRAREEKNDLVKLADYENTLAREGLLTDWQQSVTPSYALDVQHSSNRPATVDIQATLNALGYTDARGHALEVDGHYGKHTREAVTSFQHNQGLNADGVTGPHTWAALQEATRAASIAPTMAPTVAPAAVTEPRRMIAFPQMAPLPDLDATAIRTLQQHLNTLHIAEHRHQALSVTGVYDDATRTAVMDFQQSQGLPSTGVADPVIRGLIEARATIVEMQQSANRHAVSTRETSLLEMPIQAPNSPSVTTPSQPSAPVAIAPPHHVAPALPLAHSMGCPSPALETSLQPAASPAHHPAAANQDTPAVIQAQLQAVQRQMEAMNREREQEREKERTREASRATPNDPAQRTSREARSEQVAPPHAAQPLSYSNPDHPQHALYARLKELLPQGTSEARLAQSTAACYMGQFRRPEQLDEIHIVKGGVLFLSTRPDVYASIDMTRPAPTVEQTMQHVQGYDQQQAQWRAQFEEQQREINVRGGPTLHGPRLH